ncbi:MAG: hypothetical protein ACM3JI_01330 [Anaerolineae bacterium]
MIKKVNSQGFTAQKLQEWNKFAENLQKDLDSKKSMTAAVFNESMNKVSLCHTVLKLTDMTSHPTAEIKKLSEGLLAKVTSIIGKLEAFKE